MIAALIVPLALVAALLSSAATLLAFGAPYAWLLELTTHFRPYYLLAQLPVASWLLLGVRPGMPRWSGFALLLAALPNLWVVGPYLPGILRGSAVPTATAALPDVRLTAFNVYYGNRDPGVTLAYLRRVSPDILVLTEFTPALQAAFAGLDVAYPWHVLRPRSNAWGLAVYSRYPIKDTEDLDLGDQVSSHLRLLLDLPGGPAELYAVHTASPTSRAQAAQRNVQFGRLAARIAAADPTIPKLLVGDLNVSPFSPWFEKLVATSGLKDARRPFGLQNTWPASLLPVGIAIDHCLVSPGVAVSRVEAGPEAGSDHRPLECDFSILPGHPVQKDQA